MTAVISGWVTWFCTLKGHEILAMVDMEFIKDVFNLFGLKSEFKDYNAAMKIIMSNVNPPGDLSSLPYSSRALLNEAIQLYGLIHARYILTQPGLAQMVTKFKDGVFGMCPRIMCQKQFVLPIGISDELEQYSVRVYCPLCQEVYLSRAEINKRCKKPGPPTYLAYSEEAGDSSEDDDEISSFDSLMDEQEDDSSLPQIRKVPMFYDPFSN